MSYETYQQLNATPQQHLKSHLSRHRKCPKTATHQRKEGFEQDVQSPLETADYDEWLKSEEISGKPKWARKDSDECAEKPRASETRTSTTLVMSPAP